MNTKRKGSIPVTLLVVLLIAMMGFKDFGIFVLDFSGNGGKFQAGENVQVIKEEANNFTVKKDGKQVTVPKENMIKNAKESDKVYEATKETLITGTAGQPLRWISLGEKIDLVRLENTRGLFKTRDGLEGFVVLADLQTSTEEIATPAVSRVEKTLSNEKGKSFQVKPGTQLKVVDFNEGVYTVVDGSNNRFKMNQKEIKLRGTKEQVTRGSRREREVEDREESRNSDLASKIVDEAHNQLGKPYVSGDTGNRGFDCSGLTYAVYMNAANVKLPRTSRAQATAGKHVDKSELEEGDLVFFRTGGRGIGHVGLYIGGGNMIHASTGQRRMIIASIDNSYFAPRYVTARRIID